jgi:predicted nucleic acid-binding protein
MTRFLPDTSCLVAAVCSWHEHHAATAEELTRRSKRREEMVMAAPALVEAYAVLTRLPPPYRLRPQDALAVMVGSWGKVEVVAMTGAETWPFLRALPGSGIAGGSSYDAHVAACARKAKAGVILTWNVRDFERVAEGVEVASPGEPHSTKRP